MTCDSIISDLAAQVELSDVEILSIYEQIKTVGSEAQAWQLHKQLKVPYTAFSVQSSFTQTGFQTPCAFLHDVQTHRKLSSGLAIQCIDILRGMQSTADRWAKTARLSEEVSIL